MTDEDIAFWRERAVFYYSGRAAAGEFPASQVPIMVDAMVNRLKAAQPPMRWNPNTDKMEPHNYLDDQGMSKK